MKIKTSTVTFWFNMQTDVRKYLDKFNKKLEDHFFPFNVYGVPSNFDPLYPRMTAVSKSNHSNIEFSLINLRLNTKYDSNYESDLKSCIEYLKDRVLSIYKALSDCNIDVVFSAIFMTLDEKIDNPENKIIKEFFNKKDYDNIDEVGIRLSNTIGNKYYKILSISNNKNITFSKKIDNSNGGIVVPLLSLAEASSVEEHLTTAIEINDKLLYNKKLNHITKERDLVDMISNVEKEIENELGRF